jgi:hypothetical protein
MRTAAVLVGIALVALTLIDAFEVMVLPRRVTRRFRPTRLFYRSTWPPWAWIGRRIQHPPRREGFLDIFGPASLLALFFLWAVMILAGFALVQWGANDPLRGQERELIDIWSYFYLSGVTLFTLGYGDVVPVSPLGRVLSAAESGLGLAFLAGIISYLPTLFQAFSTREIAITLLDARAGSPPSPVEALIRARRSPHPETLNAFLQDWERWAADTMESHLSFPVLAYYRSQHDNQSWIAALTTTLDVSALLLSTVAGPYRYQAQLTFAMARHAAVDLALIFGAKPRPPEPDRLPHEAFLQLRSALLAAQIELEPAGEAESRLAELRGMYEPFINALARRFVMDAPTFLPRRAKRDNWQSTAWKSAPARRDESEHFT